MSNVGFDVGSMFSNMTSKIGDMSDKLMKDMEDVAALDKSLQSEAMLEIQFKIGQYNAILEATSTIAKSMTDEAKQIAQRAS